MKKKNLLIATDEELIAIFEQLAIVHSELRTAKEANRAFLDSVDIRGEIKHRGESTIEMFLQLLESSNPVVRLAVAAKALFIVPERAAPILEQLTKEPKLVGFSATMTLGEWRSGRLNPLV